VIANGFKARAGVYGYSYDYSSAAPASDRAGTPGRERVAG
jgi:hypothetical protein